MKDKIVLIFGGESVEHDISIITALQVAKNVSKHFETILVYVARNGRWWVADNIDDIKIYQDFDKLAKNARQVSLILGENVLLIKKHRKFVFWTDLSCVLNCCHGRIGEDGSLQGVFRVCNIPQSSADVLSSALCMDKGFMKDICRANNIPTPLYVHYKRADLCKNFNLNFDDNKRKFNTKKPDKKKDKRLNLSNSSILNSGDLNSGDFNSGDTYDAYGAYEVSSFCVEAFDLDKILKRINFPLIVKPANLGSSVAISVCKNRQQLQDALHLAFQFDEKVVVEKLVENLQEFNCACLKFKENFVLSSVVEVRNKGEIYSFADKYLSTGRSSKISVENLKRKKECSSRIEVFSQNNQNLQNNIDLKGDVNLQDDFNIQNTQNLIANENSHFVDSESNRNLQSHENLQNIQKTQNEETNSQYQEVRGSLARKIKNLTEKVYRLFDCCGVVRVDFLYDKKTQQLYVNEINTIPGSLAFYLFKDLPFSELLNCLVSQSFVEFENNKKLIKTFNSDALKTFENISTNIKK